MDDIIDITLGLIGIAILALGAVLVWDAGHWLWDIPKRQESKIEALSNLQIDYFLTPDNLRNISGLKKLKDLPPQQKPFDVNKNGTIAILAPQDLITLSTEADTLKIESFAVPQIKKPESFIIRDDGSITSITGKYLYQLKTKGKAVRPLNLPSPCMKLAKSSGGKVFIYGGTGKYSKRIYLLRSNNRLSYLGRLPEKVTSVTGCKGITIASTAHAIYRMKRRRAVEIFKLDENGDPNLHSNIIDKINSVACSSDGKFIYFATDNSVYAFKGWCGLALIKDAGGELRSIKNDLYVWDTHRELLMRLPELRKSLAQSQVDPKKLAGALSAAH